MQEFLEACGLEDRLRLDLDGPAGPGRVALEQPFAVIGRNASADLTLSDRRVSRRHAYLQAIAGEVFCVDLGSRAGVSWGRHRRRSGWVGREEGVVIKPFRIRPGMAGGERLDRADDPLAKQSADLDAPTSVLLEFSHEAAEPSSWRMNRPLALVGRSPQCQVRLTAPGISRFHCSLLRTQMGVWAVDLLGRGGIVVNGASVRYQRIDDGDELRIGPVLIRFRCDSTEGHVPGMLEGGAASGSRGLPSMPSVDHPRPQVLVSHRSMTGREVARRAGESRAWMGEPADSALVPFANPPDPMPQQERQQEQMFDQFQQVMTMLVQRFGDKHRDQMRVVREEITRIRQLNGELQSLHSRLSSQPSHAPPVPSPDPPPGASPPLDAIGAKVFDWPSAVAAPHAESPDLLPSTESGLSEPAPTPSPRGEEPPPLRSGRPIEGGASAVSAEEMHGNIRRRMEALERERKGHWQRIIDLMRGPQTGPSGI